MGGSALVVPRGGATRSGDGAGGRGHGARLPRPDDGSVGAVAACAAGRIRFGASRFSTSSGPSPGRYFLEAFDRTATGWRLHGRAERWIEIAAQWGTRDYWQQWHAVRAPALLIEAGNSVTPPGQMDQMRKTGHRATYLRVPGAGHLVHDDAPREYRDAVEPFSSDVRPSRLTRARRESARSGCGRRRRRAGRGTSRGSPNWSTRWPRSASLRWLAQLSSAASAKGADRIRKASITFMAAIIRPKIFRQQWQYGRGAIRCCHD